MNWLISDFRGEKAGLDSLNLEALGEPWDQLALSHALYGHAKSKRGLFA